MATATSTVSAAGSDSGGERPKLLLIDGHSVAYRAFFALPVENFSTQTGQHTNGVFGFTSMLINVLRDEQPTHIGVAFDVSRQTFRSEIYVEYKANRSKTPDEFRGQLDLVKEVLDALNIVHLEKEGYEADDVIATLATQAEEEGFEVLICTGDRDAFQLVSDNVTVLYPRRGVSDLARMTPALVEERYFATPARYPELAALVGETSDNLPGVPGVGPKTAAKWLETYDGLENLVMHAGELKGKAAEAFQARTEDVLRNRKINALIRDLDLSTTLADMRPPAVGPGGDPPAVRRPGVPGPARPAAGEPAQRSRSSPRAGSSCRGRSWSRAGWPTGWSTTLSASAPEWTSSVTGAPAPGTSGPSRWRPATAPPPTSTRPSSRPRTRPPSSHWLADPDRHKAMHDAKGPLLALWARGWDLAGLTSDTQLAAYLVRPDQRTFDLADLTIRYLKRELKVDAGDVSAADTDQLALDFGDDDSGARLAAEAAMVRARAVIDLADALDADIDARGGTSLLYGVELPLQGTLARMEKTGIAVDVDHLEALESEFGATVTAAADEAYRVLGKQINLGSPKQLQVVLFDELKMPKTRRTRTGYTTDADALQSLYAEDRAPVPRPDADSPGRHPAQADRRGSAQVGRRRRPHPHHVRADDRGHRTALQHRSEPAEHPDPDQRGTPDPGGVRRRDRDSSR